MSSAWLERRGPRWRVRYRTGGRETPPRNAGTFTLRRDALTRQAYVIGELAARRVPNFGDLEAAPVTTLAAAAERWRTSRVDVSDGTMQTYVVAISRLTRNLDCPVEKIDAQTVAGLVAKLHTNGLKKQTLRKTVSVLAMVLDHAGIAPNPARDKLVKMPREAKRHVEPPTAAHVEAVVRLLPSRYRLPALLLDATGMRVGELEALTWGDMDEPRGRWRVPMSASKTGRARWIEPPPFLYEQVVGLVPRDDRHQDRRVFDYMTSDRLRTAIAKACRAAGVPSFSPHDLRHRRVSLLHLAGMPWARIGELVGHDDITTTSRVYTHVVADELELDYERMLA